MRAYLVFSLAPVVGINSGGPANLARNVAVIIGLLLILSLLARTGLAASNGRSIMVFGRWGFVGLCLYLALLYGVTYFKLRPEGLPSVQVQLLTLLIYALVILGLRLHRAREPFVVDLVEVEPREMGLAMAVFAWVIGLGFVLSFAARQPLIYVPIALNNVVWTLLGFLLTAIALWQGVSEFRSPRAGCQGLEQEKRGFLEENSAPEKDALDDPNLWVP